jgi:hypothetical protein
MDEDSTAFADPKPTVRGSGCLLECVELGRVLEDLMLVARHFTVSQNNGTILTIDGPQVFGSLPSGNGNQNHITLTVVRSRHFTFSLLWRPALSWSSE